MKHLPNQYSLSFLLTVTTLVACVLAFLRAFGWHGVMTVMLLTLTPLVLFALVKFYEKILGAVIDFVLRPFMGP